MSIVVNTNVSSMSIQRSLAHSTSGLSTSLQRLSTGSKINKAADDAAGLTISQGLESQIRGSSVASDNAQSGINLLQTAEGDLGVIQDNLQRIRDLTVQAANGTYSDSEVGAVKKEVDERLKEIDRIAGGSKFNNINLLNGDNTSLTLQIGSNAEGSVNALAIGGVLANAKCSSLSAELANVDNYFGASATNETASFLTVLDGAISEVSSRRSNIGALQNRLDSATESLAIKGENLSSSKSRITDTDIAKEASTMTKSQILQQTSTSLLSQANATANLALSLI